MVWKPTNEVLNTLNAVQRMTKIAQNDPFRNTLKVETEKHTFKDKEVFFSTIPQHTPKEVFKAYPKDTVRVSINPILKHTAKVNGQVPVGLLGNPTKYFSKTEDQTVKDSKYQYKKIKADRKRKIGMKVPRVSYCGIRPISKGESFVNAVLGESGSIYYQDRQRCGSVWFCPDCMFKLMKYRSGKIYDQLQAYKKRRKTILFITFTLQHNLGDSLQDLHDRLLGAFNFANSHRQWIEAKKLVPVEYLRTLEVLKSLDNGWHPHLHTVFVGDPEIVNAINVFISLYKQELTRRGLLINEHTVVMEKWNGKLNDMSDYLFKGMLEKELTGGNISKSGRGKTFFELIDEDNDSAVDEYVKIMKGKRQFHHSKGFFKDVKIKTDEEILKDDQIYKLLFVVPKRIFNDIDKKGIALHLLNEYWYGGRDRAVKLLELYDCETGFMYEDLNMVYNV